MRLDGGDLRVGRAPRQFARIPSRDARESVRRERGTQRRGVTREFVAELESLVTDRPALLQRRRERRFTAERREVVVGPRDGIDPDAYVECHGSPIPVWLSRWMRARVS